MGTLELLPLTRQAISLEDSAHVEKGNVGFGNRWCCSWLVLRPSPSSAADYKHSGCADAAKAQFPDDPAARKDFKHWCKDQWKIYKKSHKYD